MATFAIFYKRADLAEIAAEAQNLVLTPQERQYGTRLWNGGLSGWSSAPQAADAQACVDTPPTSDGNPPIVGPGISVTQLPNGGWRICDPDIRVLVLSGSQISKQQTVDWLRAIGNKYPGAEYMAALGDDVALTAIEPWP